MRKLQKLLQDDLPLILLEDLGLELPSETSKQKKRFAVFMCPICTKPFRSEVTSVRKGRATKCKVCSCKQIHTVHGETKTRLHNIWIGIRDRCRNHNNVSYIYYGARGISICTEWDSYIVFRDWALANGYTPELSIDRIDPNKGYYPQNCRWATNTTQARNTRKIMCTNTTGYRGVYVQCGSFIASVGINNTTVRIGTFPTAEAAGKAYDDYIILNQLEHTLNG